MFYSNALGRQRWILRERSWVWTEAVCCAAQLMSACRSKLSWGSLHGRTGIFSLTVALVLVRKLLRNCGFTEGCVWGTCLAMQGVSGVPSQVQQHWYHEGISPSAFFPHCGWGASAGVRGVKSLQNWVIFSPNSGLDLLCRSFMWTRIGRCGMLSHLKKTEKLQDYRSLCLV